MMNRLDGYRLWRKQVANPAAAVARRRQREARFDLSNPTGVEQGETRLFSISVLRYTKK